MTTSFPDTKTGLRFGLAAALGVVLASALLAGSPARADDKVRPCAECKTPMQTVDLGKVQLDRCPSHGVWFDADELAALLREAKHFTTKEMPAVSEPKQGLLGKLAKLFGG